MAGSGAQGRRRSRGSKAAVTLAKAIKMVQDIIEDQYSAYQGLPAEARAGEESKLVQSLLKNLEFYMKLADQYEGRTGVCVLVEGDREYEVRSLKELLGEERAVEELASVAGGDFESALLDALRRCQVAAAEL